MSKVCTKYVTLDGCGSARLASTSVTEAIGKLAEKMGPTACQEMIGCASACLEKLKGKSLNDQDCKDLDICLIGCRTKASEEPLEFRAARKYEALVKLVKPVRSKPKEPPKEETPY